MKLLKNIYKLEASAFFKMKTMALCFLLKYTLPYYRPSDFFCHKYKLFEHITNDFFKINTFLWGNKRIKTFKHGF